MSGGLEFWIAVAGPAVNVVIAGALGLGLWLGQVWQPLDTLSVTRGHFAERLLAVNVFLVLFNLLPAFPMDGGRVLRSLLAMRLGHARATSIAATLGQGMAFMFGFLGLFTNPMLLLIALFVWIGAAQEAGMAQMRSSLGGATVERAMLTDYRTLAPEDSLARAVTLVLAGSQQDFPVVERQAVVGVLTRTDLLAGLTQKGPATPVAEVMKRQFTAMSPDDLLDDVVARGQTAAAPVVPVLRNGQLVGLLTLENLSEFVLIQHALEARQRQA